MMDRHLAWFVLTSLHERSTDQDSRLMSETERYGSDLDKVFMRRSDIPVIVHLYTWKCAIIYRKICPIFV
jgi:hypothetical protein